MSSDFCSLGQCQLPAQRHSSLHRPLGASTRMLPPHPAAPLPHAINKLILPLTWRGASVPRQSCWGQTYLSRKSEM